LEEIHVEGEVKEVVGAERVWDCHGRARARSLGTDRDGQRLGHKTTHWRGLTEQVKLKGSLASSQVKLQRTPARFRRKPAKASDRDRYGGNLGKKKKESKSDHVSSVGLNDKVIELKNFKILRIEIKIVVNFGINNNFP
jgi:hypothetical protein